MKPVERLLDRIWTITPHPRLLLTDADLIDLQRRLPNDAWLRAQADAVIAAATGLLTAEPFRYALTDDDWLLATARRFLRHSLWLGLAWRLTGETRYRERLLADLVAVTEFREWCPCHWLDVAEFMAASAIAYDWLYPSLTQPERDHFQARIMDLGLAPAIDAFFGDPDGLRDREGWWRDRPSNWNQVCNGGIIAACLAVLHPNEGRGERFSDRMLDATAERMARRLLPACWSSIPASLEAYGPDGGYPEGTNYWGYGTSYTALTSAMLTSAMGDDNGLTDIPGLADTCSYAMHAYAPSGRAAWYGDSESERQQCRPNQAMGWLARRHQLGTAMTVFRELTGAHPDRAHPLDVIWAREVPAGRAPEPVERRFRGKGEIAFLRSAWSDPMATWAYLKAGATIAGHGHIDLGSFELEAQGVRWATDLGMDSYGLKGYWDWGPTGSRWQFWRCNGFSHNMCLLDGRDLTLHSRATITRCADGLAIAELADAYRDQGVASAHRGLRLLGERVQVRDEFELQRPASVAWGLTTAATVRLGGDGRSVILARDGKEMLVVIQEPAVIRIAINPAPPAPPTGNSNAAYTRITVTVDAPAGTLVITAAFLPAGAAELPALQPLADW